MTLADSLRRLYTAPKGARGNRVQGAVLERYETARVGRLLARSERLVLVHTMGKVGSMALAAAIEQSGQGAVFHTHRLASTPFPREGLAPRRTWFTSDILADRLQSYRGQVCVVTVVRDPVERNISGFFQNIERYLELSVRQHVGGALPPTGELVRSFVDRFPHVAVTTWFDREIRDGFDIDVYADPFDPIIGHRRYERGPLTLHVLRYERLAEAPELLSPDLAGIPPLAPRNTSSSKWYAEAKSEFERQLRLAPDLIHEIYGSRYALQFFTPAERRAAAERWSA